MFIKKRSLLLVMAAAVSLSACTVRMHTVINPDETGEMVTEIGFSQEDIAMMEGFETGPEDFCDDAAQDPSMPSGSTANIEERSDGTWCVIRAPFSTLAALRELYEEGEGIQVNRLELTEDMFYYDITLDMESEDLNDLEMVDVELEFIWQVTVPGRVSSHNADSVDGSVLAWQLTPGQSAHIQAESSLGGGINGMFDEIGVYVWVILCCLCLLVLAVAAGAVFFFVRKREA